MKKLNENRKDYLQKMLLSSITLVLYNSATIGDKYFEKLIKELGISKVGSVPYKAR